MIIAEVNSKHQQIEIDLISYLESEQSDKDLADIIKDKHNLVNKFYYDIFKKRFNSEFIVGRSFLKLETKNSKTHKNIDDLIAATKKEIYRKLKVYQSRNINEKKKWNFAECLSGDCLTYDLDDGALSKLVSRYVNFQDNEMFLFIIDDPDELERVYDIFGDEIYENNKENSREYQFYKMLVDKEVFFEDLINSKFNFFKIYKKIGPQLINYFLKLKEYQLRFISNFNQEELIIRLLKDYIEFLDSHKNPNNSAWGLINDYVKSESEISSNFRELNTTFISLVNEFNFKSEYTIYLDMESPSIINKNLLKVLKNNNIDIKLIASNKENAFEYIYGNANPIYRNYKIQVSDYVLSDLIKLRDYISTADLNISANKKINQKLLTFNLDDPITINGHNSIISKN